MDDQLDLRLQAILSAAESAAVEAGDKLDILDVRNEIEAAEDRLAGLINEAHDGLASRIESVAEALRDLQHRVDEISGAVDAIQAELPS